MTKRAQNQRTEIQFLIFFSRTRKRISTGKANHRRIEKLQNIRKTDEFREKVIAADQPRNSWTKNFTLSRKLCFCLKTWFFDQQIERSDRLCAQTSHETVAKTGDTLNIVDMKLMNRLRTFVEFQEKFCRAIPFSARPAECVIFLGKQLCWPTWIIIDEILVTTQFPHEVFVKFIVDRWINNEKFCEKEQS